MKYIVALLALLLSACLSPLPDGRNASQEQERVPLSSVLALVEGGEIYCSATVIQTRHGPAILTAAHCVDDLTSVFVAPLEWYPGRNEPLRGARANVVHTDPVLDLALLSLPSGLQAIRAVPLGPQPVVLDQVVSVGHANGVGWVAHLGYVSSLQPGEDWYLVSCHLIPGMSGGPVFDSDGRVVGVNQFLMIGRLGAYTVMGGVARADVLADFVQ